MTSIFHFEKRVSSQLNNLILLFLILFPAVLSAQVTMGFQGGELGDTWGYTSTGASALSISEATQTPNKVTGTTSLVVGGNAGGGNCFASGSGNGPNTVHSFTFNALNISSSNSSVRTLTLNWGNRFPACSGTGWDSGENLIFRAYHDGVAQTPVTLATGSNNAQFIILTNSYTWSIPPCVNSFYFVISVTTNRADELLFIDNVKVTAPQLNGSLVTSPISGNTSVCYGASENYSVNTAAGISYTWSGLPAGASFTTPNGTTASSTITVNWGTTPPGTYTLSVTPANACGGTGTAQSITVTILPSPTPVTITGPTTLCSGDVITLVSNYPSGNTWTPNGETTQSISVNNPGTYTVSTNTSCGMVSATHTVTLSPGPSATVTQTAISCNGANDGALTIVSSDPNLEYSLDGITWQPGNTFSNLSPGGHTPYVRFIGGCSTTLGTVYFIQPAIVPASASNTGPYCAGTTVNLHGSTTSAGTPTFSWTGPNGFVSGIQDPTDVAQTGTSVYTLIVSINGCQSAPVTTTVTVSDNPDANASNSGPYCTGAPITLTGSTTSTGTINYSWTGPGSYTSSVQNPSDATLAGVYQLVVSANGCSSIPVSTTVVFNTIPDAQASYTSPFCSGTSLQLNGTTSSTGAVSYSWTGPNGYTSSLQNPSNGTDDGTYTLIVTEAGCSSLPSTITVVSQLPDATASNAGPYCQGTIVSLHGSTTSTGTATFSWTGPNGYTSTLQDPSDIPQTGTHTYQLIVTVDGCSSSPVTTSVTVNPSPVASISNTGPYCTGDPITLTSSTTSTGTISYSWSGPGSYTSSVQNPSDATSAGMYQLVINANGCQSIPVSTTVIINSTPDAQAGYNAPFCSGTPLELNGATSASGNVNYSWSGPNGYASSLQNPSDATTAGTYTLIVTASGCSSTPSSVTVISQDPSVTASNTGPYCQGTAIQLNGFTSSGGTVNYTWSGPGGYTSQLQNPSDATVPGTYILTIYSGNCSNTASTVVTVHPIPVASFSALSACMNDHVLFTSLSTVSAPETITGWYWDFNDGFTSYEQHPNHLFGNSGIHPVSLTVTTNSNCTASITQDIEVKPAVEADFHFSPNTISIQDPTVHFMNASSNATSYLWDFDFENAQSTEVSPEFIFPSQAGSYNVKLIAYNNDGCVDSIIKTLSVEEEIVHYVPNAFTPDGDEFNQTFKPVFSSGFDPQSYTLLIFNRWGETLFESHDTESGWDGTYRGEIVVDGTYIWNITVKQLYSDAYETFSGNVTLMR